MEKESYWKIIKILVISKVEALWYWESLLPSTGKKIPHSSEDMAYKGKMKLPLKYFSFPWHF